MTVLRKASWPLLFVAFQIVCQVGLLCGPPAAVRPLFRVAAFGGSLLLLLFLPRGGLFHPAARVAVLILILVGLELAHPLTNGALSGVAQFAMYAAILGPLLWIHSRNVNASSFRSVVLVLWTFHAVSSITGVLQVCFPGRFQPRLSPAVSRMGSSYVSGLEIETASGARTFRPMGLTDAPGGAAVSGFYTLLLGLGLLMTENSVLWQAVRVAGMLCGLACLYLSGVRMYMVMAGICLAVIYGILFLRGEKAKLLRMTVAVPVIVLLSLGWALTMGGESVSKRLKTFISDDPGSLYYSNRGFLLDYTVREMVPRYPLGAGLGRWGMIYAYFGSDRDPEKGPVWSEIQWTGWLLDGGLPLIAAYVGAVAVAFAVALRIALDHRSSAFWVWGGVLVAYNLGAVAATFTSPWFITQSGMEFWLLNAALFAATRSSRLRIQGALA